MAQGEVDLPGDQVHHLGDREDRHRRRELGDDAEVALGPEGVDRDPEVGEEHHGDEGDARLAPP